MVFLRDAYRDLVFFPDEEILRRFQAITGFKANMFRRFVPLEKILAQIDLITRDYAVAMVKPHVLGLIKKHLDLKISSDVEQW